MTIDSKVRALMQGLPTRFSSDSLARVQGRLADYERVGISTMFSPSDDMLGQSDEALSGYLRSGRSAVDLFLETMLLTERTSFPRILDLPCGFGRVTRHLVSLFPDSRIWACDLYPDRVAFCEEAFGVKGVLSKEHFAQLDFGERFDLIWVGSLLTHLPETLFLEALDCVGRHLSGVGTAIVSLHGRYTIEVQRRYWKYLPDGRFRPAAADFWAKGFGYAAYEDPAVYSLQESYGHALAKPSFVLRWLESHPELRLYRYGEASWDWHHDVVVFGRPGVISE